MSLSRLLAVAAGLLVLAQPAPAGAARWAVGLAQGTNAQTVSAALEVEGHRVESLAPLPALVVESETAPKASVAGVRYVERLGSRRAAFAPNDPLAPKQWYLEANRTYTAWETVPRLAPVRVAVIDSGIDPSHPELERRIVDARSFVDAPVLDTQGHGTFVAGLIAAETDNRLGIAGLSPGAELLVAKVVTADRTIPVEAEVRAIRWAVDQGARVINMSLGGLRDPLDSERDTYSPLEADAVAYAVSKGAVVVAAVGNSDGAPRQPWPYASYPAALPHVLGVSSIARDGSSPVFSNRDAVYNDIAAPGESIVSTLPRSLTQQRPGCPEQGYSICGPPDYRNAEGTSFSAPQVAAAAAMLLGVRPDLRAEQVRTILERTAVDATAANGCRSCPLLRDKFTGWGRLDVAAALAALDGPLPPSDAFETNDDAGDVAYTLWGSRRKVTASLDFWDDQDDVYRVYAARGQRLYASLVGPRGTDMTLLLWRPGTTEVGNIAEQGRRLRLSSRPGRNEYLAFRVPSSGFYFVHVRLTTQGAGAYRLSVVKAAGAGRQ